MPVVARVATASPTTTARVPRASHNPVPGSTRSAARTAGPGTRMPGMFSLGPTRALLVGAARAADELASLMLPPFQVVNLPHAHAGDRRRLAARPPPGGTASGMVRSAHRVLRTRPPRTGLPPPAPPT